MSTPTENQKPEVTETKITAPIPNEPTVKNPKCVEQGCRLAQISREAKERCLQWQNEQNHKNYTSLYAVGAVLGIIASSFTIYCALKKNEVTHQDQTNNNKQPLESKQTFTDEDL